MIEVVTPGHDNPVLMEIDSVINEIPSVNPPSTHLPPSPTCHVESISITVSTTKIVIMRFVQDLFMLATIKDAFTLKEFRPTNKALLF